MNLKYILIVWGAMLFCVGCSEDDVDSSYSFDVAGLKATVTNDKGSVVEMNTILLDSLQQQGFVGEVSFSEETRAENDRLAGKYQKYQTRPFVTASTRRKGHGNF